MYISASGSEIYRLNLEEGIFKEPITLSFEGCNKMDVNRVHRILACGGESSCCEFWDPRNRAAITRIFVENKFTSGPSAQVTALRFDTDGLTLAMGTSQGNAILYDIRSSRPLHTKEHQYDLPIVDVSFHNEGPQRHVLSTDKKIIKAWTRDRDTGRILTNIETPADINAVHIVSDKRGQSGLLLAAGEQSQVMTYFVPALGPAPRWCSFLEGITEELEESAEQSVYEDFKFVTRSEVEELGASGLVGTPMLKSYMHGFFMDMKLYSKLRAVSKPFEFEEHRKRKIREKIEEKRRSRITAVKRLPKVNKELAVKLERKGGAMADDRFAALFNREEFQQDPESAEYQLRNPIKVSNRKPDDSDDELDQEEEYLEPVSDAESESMDDDSAAEDELAPKIYISKKKRNADDSSEEGEIAVASRREKLKEPVVRRKPKMFDVSTVSNFKKVAFSHTQDSKEQYAKEKAVSVLPLSERYGVLTFGRIIPLNFFCRIRNLPNGPLIQREGKVRHYNSGKQGTVREMSYVPRKQGRKERK